MGLLEVGLCEGLLVEFGLNKLEQVVFPVLRVCVHVNGSVSVVWVDYGGCTLVRSLFFCGSHQRYMGH